MPKRRIASIIIVLGCLLLSYGATAVAAQPEIDGNRQLFEKGLTVYELDREITRLINEENRINSKLAETDDFLEQSAVQLEQQKKKMEKVLRSYYSGERHSLFIAALRVPSIQDAIYVWDQLQTILHSDRKAISNYMSQVQSYKSLKAKLQNDRQALADTKAAYLAQKQIRQQTQLEVDRLLAANSDRARLAKEMESVRRQWDELGLPLFERYFTALSDAMSALPELFGQNSKMVTMKGLTPKVAIEDEELNRFMQSKSKELDGFSFVFENGGITAGGKSGDISISLKGRYVVEAKPTNAVRFVIDNLFFNGYEMPVSTAKTLERQFDLAFYPNKLAPFVQATDVIIDSGKMTVSLKIRL